MTKIYEFELVEGSEWVAPMYDVDFNVFRALDGTPRKDTWRKVPVRLITEDEQGNPLRASDSPWLGKHAPVFRDRAVELLGDLLSTECEWLPLDCVDAELRVLNVTRVLDALDERRSSLEKFPSTDRIMKIKTPAFRSEAVSGARLFKIPQMLRGPVFVSEEVVTAVNAAGLKGVGFRQIWQGEVVANTRAL